MLGSSTVLDCRRWELGLPGYPFTVVGRADAAYLYVSLLPFLDAPQEEREQAPTFPPGIALVRASRWGGELVRVMVVGIAGGLAFAEGGKLLLAGFGSGGLAFIDTDAAESGSDDPLRGVVAIHPESEGPFLPGIALSADGRYAFVSEEASSEVVVVDLRTAAANGYASEAIVNRIPTDAYPTGVAKIPGADLIGVACQHSTDSLGRHTGPGRLNVIDVASAVSGAAHAVVARIPAGNPVRVAFTSTPPIGWMSVRAENRVIAVDPTPSSRETSPQISVPVGPAPVGIAVVAKGRLVVVANSNRFKEPLTNQTLSVFDAHAALEGRDARTAAIAAGSFPREFYEDPASKTLYVTNTNSRTLTAYDISALERHFGLPRTQ